MINVYTPDEVARHNHGEDLWIVIHDKVYDLTKFAKEHPGGEDILLELAGRDATRCFDDVEHSVEAKLRRDTFEIGEVIGDMMSEREVITETVEEATVDDNQWKSEESKKERSSFRFPVILATGAVIYSILFYYFWL